MALGVQFQPLPGLRGISLAPLRERWREEYPLVEEQPALTPTLEQPAQQGLTFQIGFGAVAPVRHWFLSDDGTELVQIQADRLIVNWRQGESGPDYPRYDRMRELFARRFADFSDFVVNEGIGLLEITQVEVNYINAVEPELAKQGRLEVVLRPWAGTSEHHLGEPEQARLSLAFTVPDVGRPPVRMYMSIEPAQRPDGRPVSFLTLSVRGAPADTSLGATLNFMDTAHEHLVRSFAELTTDTVHREWGLSQ